MEHITTEPDLLGECPVWDSEAGVLWWTDIEGRAIRRYAPGSGKLESRRLDHRPGSLALTSRPDHLLVAMEHQVGLFDWREGLWEPWQDLEPAGTQVEADPTRSSRRHPQPTQHPGGFDSKT